MVLDYIENYLKDLSTLDLVRIMMENTYYIESQMNGWPVKRSSFLHIIKGEYKIPILNDTESISRTQFPEFPNKPSEIYVVLIDEYKTIHRSSRQNPPDKFGGYNGYITQGISEFTIQKVGVIEIILFLKEICGSDYDSRNPDFPEAMKLLEDLVVGRTIDPVLLYGVEVSPEELLQEINCSNNS